LCPLRNSGTIRARNQFRNSPPGSPRLARRFPPVGSPRCTAHSRPRRRATVKGQQLPAIPGVPPVRQPEPLGWPVPPSKPFFFLRPGNSSSGAIEGSARRLPGSRRRAAGGPIPALPASVAAGYSPARAKSSGRSPGCAWPARPPWATLHTVKRHDGRVENVVVLKMDVPRRWPRRSKRGQWY
jgi:hypothetical protein